MLNQVSLLRGLPRIRRSARAFARAPGLTVALLLTIALGVGSNAAVYGFLQGLTRPASPLGATDRIVSIFGQDRSRDAGPLAPSDYRIVESSRGVFEWVGAARIEPHDTKIDGHSEIATVAGVTPELAGALAISPGRGVVISHHVWANEFGGRDAVGSQIRIGDEDFKITGVAPERLEGLYSDQSVDLWIAAMGEDLGGGGRERRDLWVVARLREGISVDEAQDILRKSSAGLIGVSVVPFTGIAPTMTRGLARVRLFLTFSAGAVFFIACINVASFLLGRAFRRTHETSLRIALGATRQELLWDLFADSAVVSVAGGAMGLLLGMLTAHALPAFLFEEDAARLSFAVNVLPIAAASVVCVVITTICGMLPVLGTVTDRPWMVLQREAGSPSKAMRRLRSSLVVGQIAACCMLVSCTALLVAGLHSALKTGAGHKLGDPILLTVQAEPLGGPEVDTQYFSDVEKKAKSVRDLFPMAWMARLPGNQPTWRTFRIEHPSREYREVAMDIEWLTRESIQSLDSQPVAGRMFGVNDQKFRVAVVNEEAAKELFGKQTVGMVIRDGADLPIEIIGVVKEAGTEGLREQGTSGDTTQGRRPTIYYGYLNQAEAPHTIKDARFRVPVEGPTAGVELNANVVSASYFIALDEPLVAGERFSDAGTAGQGRVAVINQEAAGVFFDGKPLGAGVIDESGRRTEIIGVVRSQVFGTFEQHAEPAIYFPMWQDCPARMTLMLRDAKWNSKIATDLLNKVEGVPGRAPGPIMINTLDQQLAQSGLAPLRIATLIGSVSAATGLLLSLLGLLSAQGDAERQRQRDRALRIALGSQRWRIVFIVMKNAGRLALVGTLTGTLLSFAFLRVMIAGISTVGAPPVQVWLIAPLLPIAAVLVASLVPARRAAVVSPMTVLRDS
jgi:ABC-type antimicrobial peptide transport system permease subunit